MNASPAPEHTTPVCRLCSGATSVLLTKDDHPILECAQCEHIFAEPMASQHVEEVYGDDYFFGGGDGYPNYLEEQQLLVKRGQYYARKLARFGSAGRMLDVGCAAGFLLKGFIDQGWQGTGIDPNPAMVKHGREHLGLDLHQGTLETHVTDAPYDLVSMIQVIAHFHDLKAAFAALRNSVKEDGLVLIETWNQQSYTARLMGQYWHEYCPPSVLNWFTPERLSTLLSDYGFTELAHGRTAKMLSVKHAFTLGCNALGMTPSAHISERIPGSWRLPYPSEDLFWAVYRRTD